MTVRQSRVCLTLAAAVLVASVAVDFHPLFGWRNYDAVEEMRILGLVLLAFAAGNGLAARSALEAWDEYRRAALIRVELEQLVIFGHEVVDDALASSEDDPAHAFDLLEQACRDGEFSDNWRERVLAGEAVGALSVERAVRHRSDREQVPA